MQKDTQVILLLLLLLLLLFSTFFTLKVPCKHDMPQVNVSR